MSVSFSLLHALDGATAYVNKGIRPAFLDENDVRTEIDRLSRRFGETARIIRSPEKSGVPSALIASWGGVELVKIDRNAMSILQSGDSPRIGLLIDFLGDLHKSAKSDLPVYRLSGGAGYVWSASFDKQGIGHLRFLAVDASSLSGGTATSSRWPSGEEEKEADDEGASEQQAELDHAQSTPEPAVTPLPPVASLAAQPEKRIALVIGNSEYRSVASLDNPVNDAKLMADGLKAVGFKLVGDGPQLDLDKAAFDSAVESLGNQLQGADVGLFYYAGHGLQARGTNYLVPVSANATRLADLDFQMVDVELVLRQMEGSGTRLNIVILDACRNNPFGGRGLRASNSGLAQMQTPESTIISYATAPGKVAQDGADGNSPYTKALADVIRKPGLEVLQTFNQVGLAVKRATGGAQLPWTASSPMEGTFFFQPSGPVATLP